MSNHHEVELEDLQSWVAETEVTFASSTRERKKLTSTLNGGLKVSINGETVWQGMQPFAAVEKYNSITEQFKN